MKRKTFLKFFSLALFAIAMFFGTFMVLTSCEEVVQLEPCEQNNTGTFIVQNTTGYTVWVDVDDMDERKLYHGGQTTYYNVPAGTRRMYIDLGDGWQYLTQHLNACETLTYTWYLAGKKSTNQLCCDKIINGVVVDTITDFERDLGRINIRQ